MNMQEEIVDEGEVILINKPFEWTSFDVANKLKRACKFKKIGHAGTLDPLATGLVILCTNKKTKQIDTYQAQEKEYTGTLVLGKTTPSIDLETQFDSESPTDHVTSEAMESARKDLSGIIQQYPPIYSAVKMGGERLYKKARRGEEVEIKPRQVEVKLFEIDSTHFPTISFRIICSKGTYMASLNRTRIGDYKLTEAWELEDYILHKRNSLNLTAQS
jgi:tRNA pseudouridine55 synthase